MFGNIQCNGTIQENTDIIYVTRRPKVDTPIVGISAAASKLQHVRSASTTLLQFVDRAATLFAAHDCVHAGMFHLLHEQAHPAVQLPVFGINQIDTSSWQTPICEHLHKLAFIYSWGCNKLRQTHDKAARDRSITHEYAAIGVH